MLQTGVRRLPSSQPGSKVSLRSIRYNDTEVNNAVSALYNGVNTITHPDITLQSVYTGR